MLGFVGVFSMIGRIAAGAFSDKFGLEWSYTIFTTAGILATIILLFLNLNRSWLFLFYIIFVGFGLGVGGGLFPAILADLYPGQSLGAIMGLASIFSGLGAASGPWITGFLHDIHHDYSSGLYLVILSFALAILAIWAAAPRKRNIFF
jgi:MFS family permease